MSRLIQKLWCRMGWHDKDYYVTGVLAIKVWYCRECGAKLGTGESRAEPRYHARDLNWKPLLGVPTGVVDDNMKDFPSVISSEDKTGPGWEHVTTLSNAKRIARRANRLERRG